MEWNLIIHGVSNGQNIWAPEVRDGLEFFRSFYRAQEYDYFEIALQTTADTTYSIYSLMVNENVIANDGRCGSYLGISIRIKGAFCLNADLLYHLMVVGVKRFLYKKLVEPTTNGLKYLVSDFKSCLSDFQQLENYFINCFTNNFSINDFVGLNGYPSHSTKERRLHWQDYQDSIVTTTLQQGAKLIISPTFQTNREIELATKKDTELQQITASHSATLQELRENHQSVLAQMDAKHSQELDQERAIKDEYLQRIAELEKELEHIQHKYSESQNIIQKGNLNQLADVVNRLEHLCGQIDFAKLSRRRMQTQSQNTFPKVKTFWEKHWLLVLILVLIIGVGIATCVYLYNIQGSSKP